MADQRDSAALPKWSLAPAEIRQLDRKFRSALLRILRELERQGDQDKLPDEVHMAQLADVLSSAGSALDEYAANCHALAATLQTYATGAEFLPGEAMPDSRLANAVGKHVVLTRTTIDELKGKVLTLERLSDNNAIIRHDEDYWGTPVDRILVIGRDTDNDPGESTDDQETEAPPALSVSPKARALMERIRAGELDAPLVLWSCGHADIVKLEYAPEKLREFVPVSALPERIAAFLVDARSHDRKPDLVLDNDETSSWSAACAFAFKLRRGELGNAIQFLTMAGREGRLDVRLAAESEIKGTIHLEHGTVVQVTYLEDEGVEALARMLVQDNLTAGFVDGVSVDGPQMSMSTDQLLIEAAVRADEIAVRAG